MVTVANVGKIFHIYTIRLCFYEFLTIFTLFFRLYSAGMGVRFSYFGKKHYFCTLIVRIIFFRVTNL